jgi:hypothetical protein
MKNNNTKRIVIALLTCGLALNSSAFLMAKRTAMSDWNYGIIVGIGLGLMVLALLVGKKQRRCNS